MVKRADIGGVKFGHLTAIRYHETIGGRAIWICQCDCGSTCEVQGTRLRLGITKSCGCERSTAAADSRRTHGMKKSPEYNTWVGMKRRCHDPRDKSYPRYGAKGVKVCDRWRNDFAVFIADVGLKPSPLHSLDRIDSQGDYEPRNCRWATSTEQNRNRSDNVQITIDGESRCLVDWAERFGIKASTVRLRIKNGWTPKDALTTPLLRSRK